MTTEAPILRKEDGSLQLPGNLESILWDYDFSTLTAIPAAFTITNSGTASAVMQGTSPNASLKVSLGVTNGSTSKVALPTVDSTQADCLMYRVWFTIQGAEVPYNMFLGWDASTSTPGASWRNDNKTFYSRNGDTPIIGGSMHGAVSGRAGMKSNIGLIVLPKSKTVITLRDGAILNAGVFPAFQDGLLIPEIVPANGPTDVSVGPIIAINRVQVKVRR